MIEKAKAMRRYNHLQTFLRLFRVLEVALALFLLSWLSSRLPFVVKVSGKYLGKLIPVLISPMFMFLIGNGIVFTLLAKSGYLFGEIQASDDGEDYKAAHVHDNIFGLDIWVPDDIVYDDKEIVSEVKTVTSQKHCDVEKTDADLKSDVKTPRRSQSDNLGTESDLGKTASGKLLQWSVTDKCQKDDFSAEAPVVSELNNEEFQRAIEEFIANQIKFHKEEKLAIASF